MLLPLALSAPGASALTPTPHQELANETAVEGPCSITYGQPSDEAKHWMAVTIDPERVKASSHGGNNLVLTGLPHAELPEWENITPKPEVLYAPSFQAEGHPEPGAPCQAVAQTPDASLEGTSAVKLARPGPYVFEEYDSTVEYTLVAGGGEDPTPVPCGENDSHYLTPAEITPPPDPEGSHWAPAAFCNKVTAIPFYVKGDTGKCPATADMSQWPTVSYISQYDTGAAQGLPVGSGRAGGNACGPSSMLMALNLQNVRDAQEFGTPPLALPDIGTVFDNTMESPRAGVEAEDSNQFLGYPNAVAYAKSIGYKQAKTVSLASDTLSIAGLNLAAISNALGQGPVEISTAFGVSEWGITGGGHMILLTGFAHGDEFTVDDPAGNYFSTYRKGYSDSAGGHYGPGSCGYEVAYPEAWVLAMSTGRWFLTLGHRHPASPHRAGSGFSHPAGGSTYPARSSAHPATSSEVDSALALYDAHPGQNDAPTSFYLEDPEGRKAGYVAGQAVAEIPDASVGQDPEGFTDPAVGDSEIDPSPPAAKPTPRAVVLPDPQAGTTVHVVAGTSGSYALNGDAWVQGTKTAGQELAGSSLAGTDVTVDSSALDSLTAPAGPGGSGEGSGQQPTGANTSGAGAGTQGSTGGPSTARHPANAADTLHAGAAKLHRGRLSVTLSCRGASGSCVAKLALTVKSGHKLVHLLDKRVAIPAGGSKSFAFVLAGLTRKLPGRLRHASATLRITGSGGTVVLRSHLRL